MASRKKITLISIAVLIAIVVLTVSITSIFLPKRLADLIELKGISEIYILEKDGNSDVLTCNAEPYKITKVNDFMEFITSAVYKNRIGNVENTDKYLVKIIYSDGTEILMDSFNYRKVDKNGKILKQKKILVDINYDEYYG